MVLGREAGEGPAVSYHLLGQVPVKMEDRPGEGIALVAYDPLRGGFVADASHYSAIKRQDRGTVVQITAAAFAQQVELLKGMTRIPDDQLYIATSLMP